VIQAVWTKLTITRIILKATLRDHIAKKAMIDIKINELFWIETLILLVIHTVVV
jgi:hypothetical protein